MSSPYDTLSTESKEIRLIHVEPAADPNSRVVCSSQRASLLNAPAYTALSYCWGDSGDKPAITFNGVSDFAIPRSLESALRQLRQSDAQGFLWADAISINQDPDTPEKSHQVSLMHEIYSKAASTVVWLGEAADDSGLAMDTISRLHEHSVWEIEEATLSAAQFRAMAALNARQWWSRTWVVQELLLSPNPVLMCGKRSAPIEAFVHLDDLRRGYHRPTGETIDNSAQPSRFLFKQHPFSQILHHYYSDKQRVQAGIVSVEEWVVVVNDFHATDPRDKIYGLLGLGTEEDRLALPPDYTKSNTVANVYARATAHFILQRRDLLHLQFNASDIDATLGLPSWCPDYSRRAGKEKERYAAFVVGMHENEKLAAGGMESGTRLNLSALKEELFPRADQDDWTEIRLRGWEVDEVVYSEVNPYLPPYGGSDAEDRLVNNARRADQTRSNVLTWETEARRRLETTNPYAPKMVDDVFWRSLMANRTFTWNPVPDSCKELYDVWIGHAPLPISAAGLAGSDAERRRLHTKPFADAAITRTHGRAFIITRRGYLGLAPRNTRAGDVVSVVKGGSVPFVLRERSTAEVVNSPGEGEQEQKWELVGESFVMGLMEGQGVGTGEEKAFLIN